MQWYDYACSTCGRVETQKREVEARNDEGTCACGGALKRKWSMPAVNLNIWAFGDRPSGLSEKDAIEEQKRYDRVYEARWEEGRGRMDLLKKPKTSMQQHLAEAMTHAT